MRTSPYKLSANVKSNNLHDSNSSSSSMSKLFSAMRARRGTPLRKSARANQRVWGSSTFSFWRANLEGGVEPSLHLYRYDLPSQRGSCGRRISSAGSPSNAFASRYSVLGRVLLSPVSNRATVAGLIPASCARSACVQSRLARSITMRSASGDRFIATASILSFPCSSCKPTNQKLS